MKATEPRLQRQLLAWLLGPLALLLVLDSAAAWWNAQRFANLAHDRALAETAREIGRHVQLEQGRPRLNLSPQAAEILLQDPDDTIYFRVFDDAGAALGGDADLPAPRGLLSARLPQAYTDEAHAQPVRMLLARVPLGAGAEALHVRVQVAETLNKRRQLAWEMLAHVVLPQVLLIVLAVAVVWWGVSHGLAPLQRMRRALAERSHTDLSPIDTSDVPGEVRPLVDEVNELMARLARTIEFQGRFVADAAHQLKTPVSGLKAQIELALRESDPARVQHSLAQLYVSADRLSRLVRQLLALARNEPGAMDSVRFTSLDLNAFALEVSMEWVPQALRSSIDLGFEGAEQPLLIDADAERLRELINNLVDNAIRYSQKGGRVTVRVQRDGVSDDDSTHVRLAISDDGPRIPEADRQRVFERFHRLLGTQESGSGLGLAIVSEIASLHRARITLEEDSDGVGNTFSVIFPARRSKAGEDLSAG